MLSKAGISAVSKAELTDTVNSLQRRVIDAQKVCLLMTPATCTCTAPEQPCIMDSQLSAFFGLIIDCSLKA